VSSLPTWATWSIAVAALRSLVLAFLIAVAVEFLIGSLMDFGGLLLLPFVAAGALGWLRRQIAAEPAEAAEAAAAPAAAEQPD